MSFQLARPSGPFGRSFSPRPGANSVHSPAVLDVLDLSALELALCLAMMAIAALVQGTVGFGFAIVSVPVLSLVNPALAPVPQLLVQVPLSFGMFLRERRHELALRDE